MGAICRTLFASAAAGIASISMLATLPSWAGENQQCQTYASVALNQRAIAKPKLDHNGTGDGCPGAEGPRWTHDTAEHFNWCMDVEPDFAASETEERRKFLLDCTRKNEARKWGARDTTSCANFSAGFLCDHSPDADGLKSCQSDGNKILDAVNKIRADRTLLHDHTRDPGLNWSRYYHHFNHWRSYECVLKKTDRGQVYALEGIIQLIKPQALEAFRPPSQKDMLGIEQGPKIRDILKETQP